MQHKGQRLAATEVKLEDSVFILPAMDSGEVTVRSALRVAPQASSKEQVLQEVEEQQRGSWDSPGD